MSESHNNNSQEGGIPFTAMVAETPKGIKTLHLRHTQIHVTSPSDNLSPCSQKLMAADRVKGMKPKSLGEVLKSHRNVDTSKKVSSLTQCESSTEFEDQEADVEDLNDQAQGDDEGDLMHESPTRK